MHPRARGEVDFPLRNFLRPLSRDWEIEFFNISHATRVHTCCRGGRVIFLLRSSDLFKLPLSARRQPAGKTRPYQFRPPAGLNSRNNYRIPI